MTEKDYSGATTSKIGKNASAAVSPKEKILIKEKAKSKIKEETEESSSLSEKAIKNYIKAGHIAKQAVDYAKQLIKPDMLLSEIAEKIEAKILELGGELAFPVNLSIDDIAAHYTPALRDDKKAQGLLKVDLGVHIKGYIADTAFSLDLTKEKKYSKLIEASQKALKAALEHVKINKSKSVLSEIGKIIQEKIASYGFSPIRNLSGHGLSEFDVHSGFTIPNYENNNMKELGDGAFAIEPFATSGAGIVYDGSGSNIYHLTGEGQVRDSFSREVLDFIIEKKQTLPFSQRELEKKFGSRIMFAISNLKRAGIIEEYSQLVEQNHQPVSQAEASFIIHSSNAEIIVE